MDLEVEVEGTKVKVKVKVKVDTGFQGELLVEKGIFDEIPAEPSDGPRICTASMQCYETYVKLANVSGLGKEAVAEILYSPVIDKNIIGERLLEKLGL